MPNSIEGLLDFETTDNLYDPDEHNELAVQTLGRIMKISGHRKWWILSPILLHRRFGMTSFDKNRCISVEVNQLFKCLVRELIETPSEKKIAALVRDRIFSSSANYNIQTKIWFDIHRSNFEIFVSFVEYLLPHLNRVKTQIDWSEI